MVRLSLGWIHFDLVIGNGPDFEGRVYDVWFRLQLSHALGRVHGVLPFVGEFFYVAGVNIPPAFGTWREIRQHSPNNEMF